MLEYLCCAIENKRYKSTRFATLLLSFFRTILKQLSWLARKSSQDMAAQSFAAIGTALRLLQVQIRNMQKAYAKEAKRLRSEDIAL